MALYENGKKTGTASFDPSVDYHARAVAAAAAGDWAGVASALTARQAKIDAQGGNDRGTSNAEILESLRRQYGGPDTTADGAGTPSGGQTAGNAVLTDRAAGQAALLKAAQTASADRLERVDANRFQELARAQYESQVKQSDARIDRASEQSMNELSRTLADAEPLFQAQQDQISLDEALAKDNQALYAAARGDRGGVGAAQYDAVMNTAARNRQAVNDARIKLATDTARQMADLRSQGEFQKADAALELTQQYLSRLREIEQWALSYNQSVDQFNARLDQWTADYQMDLWKQNLDEAQRERQFQYQLTRDALSDSRYAEETAYSRAKDQRDYEYRQSRDQVSDQRYEQERADTLAKQERAEALEREKLAISRQNRADAQAEAQRKKLASAGELLLKQGIVPSASQLEAMGLSLAFAQSYAAAVRAKAR